MRNPRHRRLTKEVEDRCLGVFLAGSRGDLRALAKGWALVLDELPPDLEARDVHEAITSPEFESLNSRSWGLLLSKKFMGRFFVEIKKKCLSRRKADEETEQYRHRVLQRLRDPDPLHRRDAVERLSSWADARETPRLLASLLLGMDRDKDPRVRMAAMERLYLLVDRDAHLERRETIKGIIKAMQKDENQGVREEASCLLRSLEGRVA